MAEERVSMQVALRQAQESLAKGQHQEVVKLCKIVLRQDRTNYDGSVLLGSALLQLKQYVPAERALRHAVSVNAAKMAAWQRLTELYETTDNAKDLVEACRETRGRARALGKTQIYVEYTRKLVVALSATSDYEQACIVWQEVLDSSSYSEAILAEAIRGLAESKSSLLEIKIEDEYKKRLSEHTKASFASEQREESPSIDSPVSTCRDDILLSVEEEFTDIELSKELESLLRNITSQSGSESEHQHELLLRLLLRRTRATRHTAGKDWRIAKIAALQQCVVMILSYRALTAFEVASKYMEEDDFEEIFKEVKIGNENWKVHTEPVYEWFGKVFAHVHPGHGLTLAALVSAMQCSSSHISSVERTRLFCERSLRLEENSATGWQVLAEIHVKQGSYSSAAECVRRGLDAVSRSRAIYGLSLRIAEMKLLITLGESHLACQQYAEADSRFLYVAEASKALASKEGQSLVALANEGLAKVGLAQGELELAGARLSLLLSLNARCHWALAELGWLAFQKGDQKKAVQYLEQAVAIEPCDAGYHRRLGLLYWKAGGEGGNLKEKALPQFLEAVKLDPSQSDVFRYLGHYYKDIAEDVQRAARCYQKSITLDPEDNEAGEALCDLLDIGGQEVLEFDICRGASQRSRRAFWAWRRLGFLQVQRMEWSEAVPNLQHALRGYVTDAHLWEALGLAYQHLGMLTGALKAYGRTVSLENSSPVFALIQSGNILLLLASYDKAINVFQGALQKVPKHVGALCGLAAAMLGRARECIVTGAFSWSATLAKDAVDFLSDSMTSCSNVGAFWKLLGDLEVTFAQAVPCELIDSASSSTYDLDAESLRAAFDLWNQTRLSALKNAVQHYERALHLCPSQGSLHTDLGIAFDFISSLEQNKANKKSTWLPAVNAVCGGLLLNGDKPDLWVALGMLTKHKGLRQHAFIQALRIDATHPLAWSGLGQLYIGEGNDELARDAFDCARCANPALPLPWAGMAFIHSFVESERDLQEAYASCLYAVQLSPTVEVQLGLGKLAARTHQLEVPEVDTALEQAVRHAPLQAAAHNLRGLSCESRGDNESAIRSFILARCAVSLDSRATKNSWSTEFVAVSLNLARVLCKTGSGQAAVREYEQLSNRGFLQGDAGALRGYAVALWESGSTDEALTVARKSAEVDLNSQNVVGGLGLVAKMVYAKDGPRYALKEIQDAPKDTMMNARFVLSTLAVAAVCVDEAVTQNMKSHCSSSFSHDTAIQACLLAAAGQQIIPGQHGYKGAIQHLQKALHLYPQSCSLRSRLGDMLLESSSGENAHLAARCCGIRSSYVQYYSHYGSICKTLATAACACAVCGDMGSVKFCLCPQSTPHGSSLSSHVQRWVHKEPWNAVAHYYLVLSFLQQARVQNYPLNLCQTIRRMAATTLSMLLTCTNIDASLKENVRLLLLVAVSECSIHAGDFNEAIGAARSATKLDLSVCRKVIAVLQLGRCYGALQDYKSLLVELSKARSILTSENILSWLALIELEHLCKPQGTSSHEICRKAILESDLDEQDRWMGLMHLVYTSGCIRSNDLWTAQKVAAETSALLPGSAAFLLLHGALCLEIVSMGSNPELLFPAVRSLTKAVQSSDNGAGPLASMLLCKALAAAGKSKSGDISKWEKILWTEWSVWPSESRPSELYFQIGMLVKKAQGTLLGEADGTEVSWTSRAWLQRAVRLRPDSISYIACLEDQ